MTSLARSVILLGRHSRLQKYKYLKHYIVEEYMIYQLYQLLEHDILCYIQILKKCNKILSC